MRAARDLFLAQGYDKTSLAQITREARVSTGALFMCSTSSRLRPAIPGTA
ncbi:helix-turn-helix domain-containing protein [Streptomyces sp. TUS-ST3]|nr:helix-turn-helix domain-containing protein [Streptomyces sp. TUS-ST3]